MKKTKLIPFVAMAGLVASSLPLGLVTSCKSNDNEKSDIAINLTGAVASSYAVDTQSISSTNGTLNFTIVRTASSNDANAAYAVGIVSMSANSVSNDAIAFAPFTDYQFNFKDADSYSNIIVTVSQAKTQELLNSGATLNVQLSQSNMNDASFVSVYCNNYDAQITYDNPEYDANGNLVIDHIKVINSENDTTYSGVNAYCFVGSSLKVAFDNGYITQN
ncbi:MAG: hypothetical protein MJ219_04430 [Mycoplasmoidaceae bacterium]|nr:hypothetical protein [Mycoplasmoidaceae bacterium]